MVSPRGRRAFCFWSKAVPPVSLYCHHRARYRPIRTLSGFPRTSCADLCLDAASVAGGPLRHWQCLRGRPPHRFCLEEQAHVDRSGRDPPPPRATFPRGPSFQPGAAQSGGDPTTKSSTKSPKKWRPAPALILSGQKASRRPALSRSRPPPGTPRGRAHRHAGPLAPSRHASRLPIPARATCRWPRCLK